MTAAWIAGSPTRQTRVTVPPSSVASPQGSPRSIAGSTSGQASSVLSEKIGERLWRVRAGQVEPVLLGAGQGALVGADLAGAVVLDPDPGEDAVAGVGGAVGAGVVLGHRPDRRLGVVDQGAGLAPGLDRLGGRARRGRRSVSCGPVSAVGFGRSIATAL